MKRILLASSLLISLGNTMNTAHGADVYSGQNISGGRLDLFLRGFFDQNTTFGSAGDATDSAMMAFDWTGLSAKFQNFDFAFSGDSYTQSHTYTTGPGQTKTITTTVYVNPLTVSASSLAQFSITPGQNGLYSASDVQGGVFNPLQLSGSVVITGPTQSATVPFSVSIPSDANIHFPILSSIDTHAYPSTVTLNLFDNNYAAGQEAELGWWFVPDVSNPLTLANTTVDGVNVDVGLAGGYAASTGAFDLQPVPEPAVGVLLLLGLGGAVAARRKR
jgi:hypothetical protein